MYVISGNLDDVIAGTFQMAGFKNLLLVFTQSSSKTQERFEEITRSAVYYLKLGISLWQVICKTNGFSFLKIDNDSGQRGPLCLTSILFIIANNSPLSQRTPVYPSAQVHV